jgi:hypothetical protein
MMNQEKINEMEIEKETAEYNSDKIFFSKEIIDSIKRSREGIGYLTIENIAMCIQEAMGEDTEKLIEELTNRLK